MEDWQLLRQQLCGLAEEITIGNDYRLVCRACKCHLPPDKNGVLSHLNGKKHAKSLVKFKERNNNKKNKKPGVNTHHDRAEDMDKLWRYCRQDEHVEIMDDLPPVREFMGCDLIKAGNGWNEDETEIDREACKEIICGLENSFDELGVNSLWDDDVKVEVDQVDEAVLARLTGFSQKDRDTVFIKIAETDTFACILPEETPFRRISDAILQPVRHFKKNRAIVPSPIVLDPVILIGNCDIDVDGGLENDGMDTAAVEIEGNEGSNEGDERGDNNDDGNMVEAAGGATKPRLWFRRSLQDNDVAVGDRNNYIALHYQVIDFVRFISPTEREEKYRKNAISTIEYITQKMWPGSTISLYGSYANDLVLPTGDLDMCLTCNPVDENGHPCTQIEILERLAHTLRGCAKILKRVEVARARVPIVKVTFRQGNVPCDICVNHTVVLRSVDLLANFRDKFRPLKPLTLTVKFFLAQKGLNEIKAGGGLNSFAICMLVLSHLQNYRINFPDMRMRMDDDDDDVDDEKKDGNLGRYLVDFFYFYGYMFNYCTTGIDVKNATYYKREKTFVIHDNDHYQRYSIMDPNDSLNEMGIASKACAQIRLAFREAYLLLTEENDDVDEESGPILAKILFRDEQGDTRGDV